MHAARMSVRHGEYCPLDCTLGILSGKWKSIIVCRLMHEPLHFGEIHRSIPSCSKRTLAMQLAKLEEDGIVARQVEHEGAVIRTRYSLTESGASLATIVRQMDEWGMEYLSRLSTLPDKTVQAA
jgi:DNA-binding HxlR family transcriptional regulator